MRIAVEGCAHGELEKIYESISHIETQEGVKVDLLICCGDFQSTRNLDDLQCMAVPPKYYDMCTFYKYYNGEKTAPVLTIFIGGNHEASNYLQELPYGGWVAPNIYYLGYAGVISIAGVRIGGLSGIYKGHDFNKGHFESSPYDENTKRSVYHIRNLEVFRLKQMTKDPIDIFLSHDWPRGIYNHGNVGQLLRHKPFLSDEIASNSLGSKPCEDLLNTLQPTYWFSAHLHTKFAAMVHHDSPNKTNLKTTKFLALDRCMPRKRFLQLFEIPHDENETISIKYDLEWLTVLFLTNHLLSVKSSSNYMPGEGSNERWIFTPTDEERNFVFNKFDHNLVVPLNFVQTAPAYNQTSYITKPEAVLNPQTEAFCDRLSIDDPLCLVKFISNKSISNISSSTLDKTTNSYTDFISFNDSCALSPMAEHLPTPKWINADKKEQISPARTSLSLPSPKLSELNSEMLKPVIQSPISIENTSCFSEDTDENTNEIDSIISRTGTVSNSQEKCLGIAEDITKQTPPKKFKRRNEKIYNSV